MKSKVFINQLFIQCLYQNVIVFSHKIKLFKKTTHLIL